MANECTICGDRRIETYMLFLGPLWCEFCANCADAACLKSPEGETKTPREVWDSVSETPCSFPVLERHEPPVTDHLYGADFCDCRDCYEEEYAVSASQRAFDTYLERSENALEDRETLAELGTRFDRSMSFSVAWQRDGYISAKGSKGRGWKKPRNRLRDKRLAA